MESLVLFYILLAFLQKPSLVSAQSQGCNTDFIANQLVSYFIKSYIESGQSCDSNKPLEELATRWYFNKTDVDNDTKLSGNEINFARYLARDQSIIATDECATAFLQGCLLDNGSYLSVEELLECTINLGDRAAGLVAPVSEPRCPEQLEVDYPQCLEDVVGCTDDAACSGGRVCCEDINCNYKICMLAAITKVTTSTTPSIAEALQCPLNRLKSEASDVDGQNKTKCYRDDDCSGQRNLCCWQISEKVCVHIEEKKTAVVKEEPSTRKEVGNTSEKLNFTMIMTVLVTILNIWLVANLT